MTTDYGQFIKYCPILESSVVQTPPNAAHVLPTKCLHEQCALWKNGRCGLYDLFEGVGALRTLETVVVELKELNKNIAELRDVYELERNADTGSPSGPEGEDSSEEDDSDLEYVSGAGNGDPDNSKDVPIQPKGTVSDEVRMQGMQQARQGKLPEVQADSKGKEGAAQAEATGGQGSSTIPACSPTNWTDPGAEPPTTIPLGKPGGDDINQAYLKDPAYRDFVKEKSKPLVLSDIDMLNRVTDPVAKDFYQWKITRRN